MTTVFSPERIAHDMLTSLPINSDDSETTYLSCFDQVCQMNNIEQTEELRDNVLRIFRLKVGVTKTRHEGIGRVKALPMPEHWIEYGSSSIASRKNAICMIKNEDLYTFCEQFIERCEDLGTTVKFREEQYDKRLVFSFNEFIKELNELNSKSIPLVGLFLEDPIIGYDEHGKSNKDSEHLAVWIYFTIQGKALTRFRKFLLNEVIEILNQPEK